MRVCKITEAVDKMNAGLLLISPAIFELGSTHGMLVGDGLKTDKRKYFLYSDNDSGICCYRGRRGRYFQWVQKR